MTTATEMPGNLTVIEEQNRLRSRLARLRRRLRLQMALEFLVDACSILVATAALLVLCDWWFRLGSSPRFMIGSLCLVGLLAFSSNRAFRRWRATRHDDLAIAMMLDRFRPGTGGRIADILQLPEQLGDPSSMASPAMIHLAVQRATEALAASDWETLWNRRRSSLMGTALLFCLLVPIGFGFIAPQAARLSLDRWLFGSNERWPQRTYLSINGLGDRNSLLAPSNEPFTIEVRSDLPALVPEKEKWIIQGRGEPLPLPARPKTTGSPTVVRVREQLAKGKLLDSIMTATGLASFRHELPPSSTSTTFNLSGGDDWLGPITVERVDRPLLKQTKLRVKEPGSPGQDFRGVEEGSTQPVFLPDTEIEMTLVGDQPLSDARLTVHPGEAPKLSKVDPSTFVTRWILREPLTIEIEVTSLNTKLTSKPSYLSIGILKDREPRVTLRPLGIGAHVTPVATIPLSIVATDDIGLAAVRLQEERTVDSGEGKGDPKSSKKTIPLPVNSEGSRAVLDHQARHDIELQAEPPAVGTILRLVAEAEDRCARGTQIGRSTPLLIQVVPPNELFYEILLRQRAERLKFIAILEAAEKQTPLLAGTPTSDTYANIMRGLHSGTRQLDLSATRIAESLQEMKLNQVGSPKSYRLLQEGVIDSIRALNAGPSTELRTVLQALSGSGAKSGAKPDDARRLHGLVVNGLKTILEQMSQWESFVDVVNQVAEVIKMQQNILQSTEKARESRTQEVFDEKP